LHAVARTAAEPRRELAGEKATRIVEAMRTCVAARGFSGATFDQIAREAGVSRGLLHYYFGAKERLLTEAVRREADVRLERLDEAVAPATNADEVMAAMVRIFEEFLGSGPSRALLFFEILTLAQRNSEIAAELAELARRMRSHLADVLREKAAAGVLGLKADADAAAGLLLALVDGVTVRRLAEPELDIAPLMAQAVAAARALLD
jgi:AcrR family transcriptional regulator